MTRANRRGAPARSSATAPASRSPSSYQSPARRSATDAATRAGSAPRRVRANASTAPGPVIRSSRHTSRSATTVDGWVRTDP